jgi:hypothetical protein
MAKLYIANCTKQVQELLYKIHEIDQRKAFRVTIPVGGQALIYREAEHQVLMKIVDQHLMYGLRAVSEIDRTKDYTGMCYQFDKPIDVEKIMYAMAQNEKAVELMGHEVRKQAAAGLSNSIDNMMMGSEQKLTSVEVEVVEQPKNAGDTEEKMVETIQVAKPGSKAAIRGAQKASERN